MKTQEQHARFAVSYPHGGAYLVASLVGQYIIKKYGVTGKISVETALCGNDYGFHPLVPTNLHYGPGNPDDCLDTVRKLEPHQKMLIVRDPSDCLAAVYLDHKEKHPNLTADDFLSGKYAGARTAFWFNHNVHGIDFCEVIPYENMVEYPETWVTRLVHRCIGELNDDGVDLAVIDVVINKSNIKDFRESRPTEYNDSVGISRVVFNQSQLEYIQNKLI